MPTPHETPTPANRLLAQLWQRFPDHVERLRCFEGDLLLHEGDSDTFLYFLEEGSLVVEQEGEGGQRHILKILSATADPDLLLPFGEMAHIADRHRSASIRSSGGSVVVRLGEAVFPSIYEEFPEIARVLRLKLVERLKESNARIVELSARLQPHVDRAMLERETELIRAGQASLELWQCVAGCLEEILPDGSRRGFEPDPDGFVEPRAFILEKPWPRTIVGAPGSFLVRWPVDDGGRPYVFRYYPELALRLLRDGGAS